MKITSITHIELELRFENLGFDHTQTLHLMTIVMLIQTLDLQIEFIRAFENVINTYI